MIGTRLAHYEITAHLGSGGFGDVYQATDSKLGRSVVHGFEDSGGRLFLVMELVPGETLQARIERGAIPVDEALTIAKQIADALEAAHEQGVAGWNSK